MLVLGADEESNSVESLMVSHSHFWEDMGQEAIMPVSVWPADTFKTPLFQKCEGFCAQRYKNPTQHPTPVKF